MRSRRLPSADVLRERRDNISYAKKRKGGIATVVSEEDINLAAVAIARQVADEHDALISVSLCESRNYQHGKGYDDVIADFRKQLQFFVDAKCDIDFIVCEVSVLLPCHNMNCAIHAY